MTDAARTGAGLALIILAGVGPTPADTWPIVRHDAVHSGRSADVVRGPYRVAWVRTFDGEVVATPTEPIVADGRVYVGTESGHLWALDAGTGALAWRADGDGPIVHAAAYAKGVVFFGTTAGHLFAVDAATGRVRWRFTSGPGGFCTAPVVSAGRVFVGSRDGRFSAVRTADGTRAWQLQTGGPIRTTAALHGSRVLFASDDMHAYAADRTSGQLLWRSSKLQGQSLRDYYPVIVGDVAIFRTNPVQSMPERIAADRGVLLRAGGVEAPTWQALERWLRSPAVHGTPEQVEREQRAILAHLDRDRSAQTCYALDLAMGRESRKLPVLWAAGCQGTGLPPVLTAMDSGGRPTRPLVFWRTLYSNWNLGVAPLVGLGFLDLERGRVRPIFHADGAQPPWNTFWGTADESQNFSSAGDLLYICHQATLSAFDLQTRHLIPMAGNRDSWGGYPGVPGIRNEWNGPARGAAAIAGHRLYWLMGSRLIVVEGGSPRSKDQRPEPQPVSPTAPPPARNNPPGPHELRRLLARQVDEYLAGAPWAPLYVDPGIGGREFFFSHSSDAFRALSLAFPHLPAGLQRRVAEYLAAQWDAFPPYSSRGSYPLDRGRRRELFDVPADRLKRSGSPAAGPSVAWLDPVCLYAERLGRWSLLHNPRLWAELKAVFDASDPARVAAADRNRVLAGYLAMEQLAARTDHPAMAVEASRRAKLVRSAIRAEFRLGVGRLMTGRVQGVRTIDELIRHGDGLWTPVGGHKSKITLFLGLTRRAAAALGPEVSEQAQVDLATIERTMPTWSLSWGERPVHYGENFVDYPDNVLGIFAAHALLGSPKRRSRVSGDLDIPWCPGDLFFIEKLVLCLPE